jgi:cysteine desulfuration protein SufE
MTITETIASLRAELDQYPDWEERYGHIIALGKHLRPYPEEHRNETFIVKGCQSRVWLHPTFDNGIVHFDADSDAVIVKGLVALVLLVYNDRTPQEIVASNDDLRSELGLDQHLSQNRSNGLASMLKQLRLYALAYSMRKATS